MVFHTNTVLGVSVNFEEAFERLLGHEGDFVDHADDPGGATRWGITERTARAHGYTGPMRDLPVGVARGIARIAYWDAVKAEQLPAAVRYAVFDAAYNSGVGQSVKWLQQAVGVADDGVIGPKTLQAVGAVDARVLLMKLLGARLNFLTGLKTWPVFGKGWARRVASLMVLQ